MVVTVGGGHPEILMDSVNELGTLSSKCEENPFTPKDSLFRLNEQQVKESPF